MMCSKHLQLFTSKYKLLMFDLTLTKFIAGPAITIMQSNNSVFPVFWRAPLKGSTILEGGTERYYNLLWHWSKFTTKTLALMNKNVYLTVQK